MMPASFDYVRPSSLDEALRLLSDGGDDAKVLAGGHSLLPLMRLRMATPALLVDIGRLRELSYVRADGDEIAIGALTRHFDLSRDGTVSREAPLLGKVAGQVGDPQVRHRGTIGGSIVHGDPASDLPAACLALGAAFVLSGPGGERRVAADDFFTGFLETAVASDEILTEIRVPKSAGAKWSFQKFNRRAQDWAIVGCALVRNGTARVALVNMGATPLRSPGAEEALAGGATAEEAASHASDGLMPPSDLNASAEFRRHLAGVLVRRALEEAAAT